MLGTSKERHSQAAAAETLCPSACGYRDDCVTGDLEGKRHAHAVTARGSIADRQHRTVVDQGQCCSRRPSINMAEDEA